MIDQIDHRLALFFNHDIRNPVCDLAMPLITSVGDGSVFVIVALFLLLSKRYKYWGVTLLAGLTLTYYVTEMLKSIIGRARPFHAYADIQALTAASGHSMPSGHAMLSFMAAYVLSSAFGKPALFYGIAALIAVSRVYVGVHYLSDVIAGALVGIAVGFVLVRSARSALAHSKTT